MANDGVHTTVEYNGIAIDVGILDFIKLLHDNGIETFECCQGGLNDEFYETMGHHEYAFVIIRKKPWSEIEHLFPNNAVVEDGWGGYWIAEYNDDPPPEDECLYIYWDVTGK